MRKLILLKFGCAKFYLVIILDLNILMIRSILLAIDLYFSQRPQKVLIGLKVPRQHRMAIFNQPILISKSDLRLNTHLLQNFDYFGISQILVRLILGCIILFLRIQIVQLISIFILIMICVSTLPLLIALYNLLSYSTNYQFSA